MILATDDSKSLGPGDGRRRGGGAGSPLTASAVAVSGAEWRLGDLKAHRTTVAATGQRQRRLRHGAILCHRVPSCQAYLFSSPRYGQRSKRRVRRWPLTALRAAGFLRSRSWARVWSSSTHGCKCRLFSIGRDLGASTGALQWILNGYLLTLASLILLGGSHGDRYGRTHGLRKDGNSSRNGGKPETD